jgi:hypothetical protein
MFAIIQKWLKTLEISRHPVRYCSLRFAGVPLICWYICWSSLSSHRKRPTMKLKDITVRNVRPAAKPQKLSDGGGLHLLVQPNGGKLWRLAYRFEGKQKTLGHLEQ